jgi:hypothetical protein
MCFICYVYVLYLLRLCALFVTFMCFICYVLRCKGNSRVRAPWVATPQNLCEVDDLLHTLKVPSDWPSIQDALTSTSTLKIAEALALAGDIGQYVVSQLDIDPEYRSLFVRSLKALSGLLQKVPTNLNAVQQELVLILAELECKMPLHWCSSTRHFLLHIVETMKMFGAFWAWNMLPVERFHALIKRLARDRRDRLRSLSKNYQMFDMAQLMWRHDGTQWANTQKFSTIRPNRTINVAKAETHFTLSKKLRTRWKDRLPDAAFRELQDLWCVAHKPFHNLMARFQRNRRDGDTFTTWVPRSRRRALTEDEILMKKMDNRVTVSHILLSLYDFFVAFLYLFCYVCIPYLLPFCVAQSINCCTLDGVQFRTVGSQMGLKLDDASIMMPYTDEDSGKLMTAYIGCTPTADTSSS